MSRPLEGRLAGVKCERCGATNGVRYSYLERDEPPWALCPYCIGKAKRSTLPPPPSAEGTPQ